MIGCPVEREDTSDCTTPAGYEWCADGSRIITPRGCICCIIIGCPLGETMYMGCCI